MLHNQIPKSVLQILSTLEEYNFEAVLVGGCVRNLLLGIPIHDYDIATSATPNEVKKIFTQTRDTGLKHGTVTVITPDHQAIEVTTYRIETIYSDGRRPDSVKFTTHLIADLARRDFTINAIAMDVRGKLVDPFDGQSDLKKRRISAVGNAKYRFQEDGLRILRAIRFCSQLNFHIEESTSYAMHHTANHLKTVSNERIGQELKKIAESNWWQIVDIIAYGPWFQQMDNCLKQLYYGFQKLAHVTESCRNQWIQLFTPITFLSSIATWMTQLQMTQFQTKSIFKTLGWGLSSVPIITSVQFLKEKNMYFYLPSEWHQQLFTHGHIAVTLAAKLQDWQQQDANRHVYTRCQTMIASQPLWSRQELALSGHDLIKLGFQGKEIGQILNSLIQLVLEQKCENNPSSLYKQFQKHKLK